MNQLMFFVLFIFHIWMACAAIGYAVVAALHRNRDQSIVSGILSCACGLLAFLPLAYGALVVLGQLRQ